jgi:glycosyltransferase involved in cell wall biosynthesis
MASTVIYNGIELPNLICDSSEAPRHHLFTAARLTYDKNIELLLLAMQKILVKCPEATLTILGDGPLLGNLQELTRLLRIENRVEFLGYVLQPEKYFPKLGVFVLPSRFEAFGLSLLEAMAWEKPCVATEVGGIQEFLKNGENGLSVPSNNPDAMADAILRIIKDPSLARRLGKKARLTAQKFDIRKTVDQIQTLYKEQLL